MIAAAATTAPHRNAKAARRKGVRAEAVNLLSFSSHIHSQWRWRDELGMETTVEDSCRQRAADDVTWQLGQKAALDYYVPVHDVSWTYVSPPGSILPGQRTGVFRLGDDTLIANDKGESRITMEDYAVAIVNEAEDPRHIRRRFAVGY